MRASLWYLKNYPYPMLIAPWEDTTRQRILAPGEVWNEENGQEQAFIVTQGHLRIRRREPTRGWVSVEGVNPGDIVGTLATQEGLEFSEEAVAMDGCTGYVLNRRVIDYRLSLWRLPSISFLHLEGWHLRRYTTLPGDLMFRTLATRLAATLLMLAQQYPGAAPEDERTLACTPRTRHLADLTGSSVELAQQTLNEWYLRGWLDRTQGHLTLKNVAGFTDLIRSARSASVAVPR